MKRIWLLVLSVSSLSLAAVPVRSQSEPVGPLVPMMAQTTQPATVVENAAQIPARADQPPAELQNIPIALLVDLSSGQTLFSKEPDRRFMPASITKVMTLYTAFDLKKHGQIVVNQRFQMSDQAFKQWHRVGSTMFLDRTMQPSVNDLLLGIANVSANDACVVLAEGAAGSVSNWVALMNAEARRLGMKDSQFGTPNGWMDDGQTYVTAHDLVTLAQAMLAAFPDDYHRYIGHETLTWNGISQRNHDPLIGKLAGADGIKTGFTNQAGYGFLGSAERNGRRLVMVVAGANSGRERNAAARALMDWGFAAFDSRRLFAPGAIVGKARVQGGADRSVRLVIPAGFAASVAKSDTSPITMRIVYDGPLEVPVEQGSVVAALEITQGSRPPHRVPLVAANSVGSANAWQRLRNGLLGLFPG